MTVDHSQASPPSPPPEGPAAVFRHCPHCGAQDLRIENSRSLRCGHCDFLFFFNSAAASAAFILYQGQLVLCVRAKEPAQGLWDPPGGFVEFNETVEEGLRREIYEELHIEVSNFHYLTSSFNDYRYAGVAYKTTDLFYVCEATDISGIQPADDVGDYVLVAPEDVDPARLAFDSGRAALAVLRDWLARNRG